MGLFRRIGNLFHRSRLASDMDAELEAHIALRTEDNIAGGMTPREARRDALVRFGNPAVMKERTAGADMALGIDGLWRDVRYAVRQLRRSPGFALTAIVTLTVAIGANAVVFSILNALVLKPLDLPGARRLYMIEQRGFPMNSYPDYLDLRQRNHSFEDIAVYIIGEAAMNTGSNPSHVWMYQASGNYFDVLGVQPYLGRFFHSSDEHGLDAVPYIVLSYDYWRTRFHSDAAVVGRTVELNRHSYSILGVAPPKFHGSELMFVPDFWVPVVDTPLIAMDDDLKSRGDRSLEMIGRLKPQVTAAQATGELNAIAAALQKTYPKDDDGLQFALVQPGLMGNMLGGPIRAFVSGLMLLAGLILLAACANLGSLFSARAADRAREIAMRVALGSTRARILRQILTEALVIALFGGTAGIAASSVLLRGLSVWQPMPNFPIRVQVNPDVGTYTVAVLLALMSGLLCGLAPIRQIFGTAPWEVVKTGAAVTRRKRLPGLRDVLLIVQVAVCAVLMTSSLVAVRGLERSMHSNFGFQPDRALLVDTELRMAGYEGDRVAAMQRRMLDTAATVPGVQSAGLISNIPLGLGFSETAIFADGATDFRASNAVAEPVQYSVSPGYFQSAGTTLLAGRDITWHDGNNAPAVAVVNRTFAQKLFGSVDKAIGKHFLHDSGKQRFEVVGVVEDGKYITLTEETKPAFFQPLAQSPTSSTWLVARTAGDPQNNAAALRAAIHGLDDGLLFTLTTWHESLNSALFAARAAAVSLGVLGLLGSVLAITGIFGMASYSVSKRFKEMGIRIALGADRIQVLRSALGGALRLLAIGSVAGLLLGMAATRVLAFIVYQATPLDPVVLAGTVMVMLLVGLVATWAPAQRALHIHPSRLLREDW
ncbi:ABC transporter permease [Terracidiphilus gabretensis]|uniref:ABC transporter permease n=1 Tax=Terracidiphilus gabretensis TaxID=1577687 RepID=UPI00071B2224|nr:ABC transporter permease [Terracidiphilus gabretensis]